MKWLPGLHGGPWRPQQMQLGRGSRDGSNCSGGKGLDLLFACLFWGQSLNYVAVAGLELSI